MEHCSTTLLKLGTLFQACSRPSVCLFSFRISPSLSNRIEIVQFESNLEASQVPTCGLELFIYMQGINLHIGRYTVVAGSPGLGMQVTFGTAASPLVAKSRSYFS